MPPLPVPPKLSRGQILVSALLISNVVQAIFIFSDHGTVQGTGAAERDNCAAARVRMANVEAHYLRHANLEREAAKRGYTTSIDWNGLADDDFAFEASISGSFSRACGTAPTPYPGSTGFETLAPSTNPLREVIP